MRLIRVPVWIFTKLRKGIKYYDVKFYSKTEFENLENLSPQNEVMLYSLSESQLKTYKHIHSNFIRSMLYSARWTSTGKISVIQCMIGSCITYYWVFVEAKCLMKTALKIKVIFTFKPTNVIVLWEYFCRSFPRLVLGLLCLERNGELGLSSVLIVCLAKQQNGV